MLANNSYEKLVSFRPFTKKVNIFFVMWLGVCVQKYETMIFFVVVKDFAFSMSIMWREGGGGGEGGRGLWTGCNNNMFFQWNLQ